MSAEQTALTEALNDLYRRSWQHSFRKLSEAIRDRSDLPATLSHESIRQILLGKPTRLPQIITLATVLAEQASPGRVAAEVRRFRDLWSAAQGQTPGAPPRTPARCARRPAGCTAAPTR